MSYILEALKKSDQERQQGSTPSLYSSHGPIPHRIKNESFFSRRWVVGLIIAAGLTLGLTGSTLIFFHYSQPLAEKTSDTKKSVPSPLAKSEARQLKQPAQPADRLNRTSTSPVPEIIIKEKDRVIKTVPVEDRTSEPPAVINQQDAATSLPLLQELSAALQAEIPNLKFAGHTYALEPYQRLIIINGKILREGDMISPGLRLMEITWKGVTLDFKGTRFRVDTE